MFSTPKRLIAAIVFSSLFSVAGLLVAHDARHHAAFELLVVACIGTGVVATQWAASRLANGVESERWPEADIEPLRRVVRGSAWKAMTWFILVLLAIALFWPGDHRRFVWSIILLSQAQSGIGAAFRTRKPAQTPPRLDWGQIKPLHSEHWGT